MIHNEKLQNSYLILNDRGEHGDKVERANNDYDYTPTDETEDY